MPVWPANLRFCPVADSYSEEPVDVVLRTQFDAGSNKTRPRVTAAPDNISFTLPSMTRAEFAGLKQWFVNDLRRGALSFTAIHPITRVEGSFRFLRPFRMAQRGRKIVVSLELELLP